MEIKFDNEVHNFDRVKHVEYTEPNENEKKMLEGTKTAEQLLKEEAEEKPEELTEEEKLKRYRRDYITKVKVVALDRMNMPPLINPSTFSKKDKQILITLMEDVMKMSEDELTKTFNEVCNDRLFTQNMDYTTFPIYK
jgi:hypothetical protein